MRLIESIKKHEGYRNRVYRCTEGFDTIGYGFAIKDLRLDEDIASIILHRKIDDIVVQCYESFWWFREKPLKAQNIIIEMVYQLGLNGFGKFKKTIDFIAKNKWSKAGDEMLDSKWARQTPHRAKELSERMKSINIG